MQKIFNLACHVAKVSANWSVDGLIPYPNRVFSPAYRKSFGLVALVKADKSANEVATFDDMWAVAKEMHEVMKHHESMREEDNEKMNPSNALRHVISRHQSDYDDLLTVRNVRKALFQIGFSDDGVDNKLLINQSNLQGFQL